MTSWEYPGTILPFPGRGGQGLCDGVSEQNEVLSRVITYRCLATIPAGAEGVIPSRKNNVYLSASPDHDI